MLRSLDIEAFRGFSQLSLKNLGRVNLLTGLNNSGKTSVLEAIELLIAQGDARALWSAMSRRGERLWDEDDRRFAEVELCRLFHGYECQLGSKFKVSANSDQGENEVSCCVVRPPKDGNKEDIDQEETPPYNQIDLPFTDSDDDYRMLGLQLTCRENNSSFSERLLTISERGGLSYDSVRNRVSRFLKPRQPVRFLSTASLTPEEVVVELSRVTLNPEDEVVIKALRIIDPTIERIAPLPIGPISGPYRNITANAGTRGGVVARLKGKDQRVPLGSMGDGMWRLLGIALSLLRAEGGVLLVDEIDTGLHFSTMVQMWRLVYQTAKSLNVQVFATTHSGDCWQSLAEAVDFESEPESFSIQRIERDNPLSVSLSPQEARIAASRRYEIR